MKKSEIQNTNSNFVIYETDNNDTKVNVRLEEETVLRKTAIILSAIILIAGGCNRKNTFVEKADETGKFDEGNLTAEKAYDFIPPNYELYDEIWGNLNVEGTENCVLIIRATNPDAIVQDENRGTLNYNRRGIIIASYDSKNYTLILRNDSFFESDSEDGGVYFAPELSVAIDSGNLIFTYAHGRYGSWKYVFRYQNKCFELVGYESSVGSLQYTKTEHSINFLTKKMKTTIYDEREDEPSPKYKPEIQWKDIVFVPYQLSFDGSIEGLSEYMLSLILKK